MASLKPGFTFVQDGKCRIVLCTLHPAQIFVGAFASLPDLHNYFSETGAKTISGAISGHDLLLVNL